MQAAILNKPKEIVISEVLMPEPAAGQVRIKLSKMGICGSDVHLYLGHRLLSKPTIVGHEGLGFIDKLGDGVIDRKLGERVVIEPNFPCQKCKYCASGRGNICIHKGVLGVNLNGAFAEYICVPEPYAWKVPNGIDDDNAVCIEPMAVAYSALFTSKARPGDAIAIVGLGAIGLLLTHLACKLGYQVYATELNQEKRQMAEKMGAVCVQASGGFEHQVETLEAIWSKNDVVAVFECAGSDFTASLCAAAAPRGSEMVLVGLSEKNAQFKPLKIAREGISILPSIIYHHPFDFNRVIQLIDNEIVNPKFIISSRTTLGNIADALELAAQGGESKIIIEL